MTAVLERAAPAATRPAVPLRARPRYLMGLGITLSALLVAMTVLILLSFSGTFTNYAPLTAILPASSTAVQLNSPVEFRDVTVGHVASQGAARGDGTVSVAIHLDPSKLASVPSNVRATVAPVSIFGNQYIVLQVVGTPSTTGLRSGATIPALLTDKTASLQSTLGDLDHLLLELHPGQLNAALTAVASALQGQGTSLGHTLVQGNQYLQAMQPLWPTVVSDLQTLVPVADQIATSAPDVVGIFGNLVTPSQTVTGAGPQIQQLLGGGATAINQVNTLLSQIQVPFATIAAASGPFLQDISQNPNEIRQVLDGLAAWATSWTAAEASGPYLNLTATVAVANPADLGLALLGGPQAAADLAAGLGQGLVNPPTYSSASSPRLASAAPSSATRTVALERGASVLPEPRQQRAISQVVHGATGAAPSSPAVATLLLGPILEQLVGQP